MTTTEPANAGAQGNTEPQQTQPAPEQKTEATPTAPEPGESGKGAEGKTTDPAPEVKFELKVPENSPVKPEQVKAIEEFAKANKLSPEQAQAILNRDHEAQAAFAEGWKIGGSLWKARVTAFEAETLADPVIGGDKLPETAEFAKRFAEKHLSPQVRQFLEDNGLGSNVHLLRDFSNLGRMMQNDQWVPSSGQTESGPLPLKDRLYGQPKQT